MDLITSICRHWPVGLSDHLSSLLRLVSPERPNHRYQLIDVLRRKPIQFIITQRKPTVFDAFISSYIIPIYFVLTATHT
jgi:hypothetical protein